ncbi:MAG: HupE/UreJ family protein [Pseudomonadota bacterium]
MRPARPFAIAAWLAALLALLMAALPARAHVTELAVLLVSETPSGAYRVSWQMRPNTELGAGLEPIFPAQCRYDEPDLDCGVEGLVGTLGFEGIGAGQSAAMFKLRDVEGNTRVITLTPAEPTAEIRADFDPTSWAGMAEIAVAYTQIGIEHILLGIDHLLFVLGLIWIATGRWMLLKTVTAFTVAHSITLGAVTFGWVGVPELFVNVMIALSIVYVGAEVLYKRAGRETWTLRYPWAVAFFFGLLHGFGFANALVALGLPEGAIPVALIAFNLGVEIGQIAFVLIVLAMAWAWREMRVHFPDWSRVAPAYAIGGVAAFWFLDRTAVLFGA